MFLLCAGSHCNNVLLIYMALCCEHTLFNRLFPGQVPCQSTDCTTSWYIVAQSRHNWEMRASIHTQTENKLLLARSYSCQTEVHIVSTLSSDSILFNIGNKPPACSLLESIVLTVCFKQEIQIYIRSLDLCYFLNLNAISLHWFRVLLNTRVRLVCSQGGLRNEVGNEAATLKKVLNE